mgnify:CR=1 FL=1
MVLAGCASTKDAVLPQDGPSMQAIYEAIIHGSVERQYRIGVEQRAKGGKRLIVGTGMHGALPVIGAGRLDLSQFNQSK